MNLELRNDHLGIARLVDHESLVSDDSAAGGLRGGVARFEDCVDRIAALERLRHRCGCEWRLEPPGGREAIYVAQVVVAHERVRAV